MFEKSENFKKWGKVGHYSIYWLVGCKLNLFYTELTEVKRYWPGLRSQEVGGGVDYT